MTAKKNEVFLTKEQIIEQVKPSIEEILKEYADATGVDIEIKEIEWKTDGLLLKLS